MYAIDLDWAVSSCLEWSVPDPQLFPSLGPPEKLSRSKIELFLDCARCFVLDRKHGVCRPSGPGYTLNNTVDLLLKREFDQYRVNGERHPIMREANLNMVPFDHPDLETWRTNSRGVQVLHAATNFLVTGAVDDLWVDPNGVLTVVDYKATSTDRDLGTLNGQYRRQAEVYQWLLRQSGFRVSDTAYFVFANAVRDRTRFDAKLEFAVSLVPYRGSDRWVEAILVEVRKALEAEDLPASREGCEWCAYRSARG